MTHGPLYVWFHRFPEPYTALGFDASGRDGLFGDVVSPDVRTDLTVVPSTQVLPINVARGETGTPRSP